MVTQLCFGSKQVLGIRCPVLSLLACCVGNPALEIQSALFGSHRHFVIILNLPIIFRCWNKIQSADEGQKRSVPITTPSIHGKEGLLACPIRSGSSRKPTDFGTNPVATTDKLKLTLFLRNYIENSLLLENRLLVSEGRNQDEAVFRMVSFPSPITERSHQLRPKG